MEKIIFLILILIIFKYCNYQNENFRAAGDLRTGKEISLAFASQPKLSSLSTLIKRAQTAQTAQTAQKSDITDLKSLILDITPILKNDVIGPITSMLDQINNATSETNNKYYRIDTTISGIDTTVNGINNTMTDISINVEKMREDINIIIDALPAAKAMKEKKTIDDAAKSKKNLSWAGKKMAAKQKG